MPGFTALNLEPEDDIEDEVDDTKEIQIEEAFKLYQNALKLHSQGPKYYVAAQEAYQELFSSEVFRYPEITSAYVQEQQDDHPPPNSASTGEEPGSLLPGTTADSAANSLPQLVHLSYKSRAQFVLDVAHHNLEHAPPDRRSWCQYYLAFCRKSLNDSASALEHDDTDIDLWKKAARISEVLSSQRLVRFCLESVVAADEEGGEQSIDLSGLDEAFAVNELRQVIHMIQDDLNKPQSELCRPQPQLLRLLQMSNDPFPFLPHRAANLDYIDDIQRPLPYPTRVKPTSIFLYNSTKISLTETILEALQISEDEEGSLKNGQLVYVTHSPETSSEAHSEKRVEEGNENDKPAHEETITEDHPKHTGREGSADTAKSPASFHSAQDVPTSGNVAGDKMEITTEVALEEAVDDSVVQPSITPLEGTRLPTRKRSSTAAGMEEPEARTKSKRLRARESLLELAAQEEDAAQEQNQYNREQHAIIKDADEGALQFLNDVLEKANMTQFGGSEAMHTAVWNSDVDENDLEANGIPSAVRPLFQDIREAVLNWSDERNPAIMSGHGGRETVERSAGLNLFLRHLKVNNADVPKTSEVVDEGDLLHCYAQLIPKQSIPAQVAAFYWLTTLFTTPSDGSIPDAPYLSERWDPKVKQYITKIVASIDGFLESNIRQYKFMDQGTDTKFGPANSLSTRQVAELAQTIFELHLDLTVSSTDPRCENGTEKCASIFDRLHRWAQIASDCMQMQDAIMNDVHHPDSLALRYIWASTKLAAQTSDNDKSHILVCLRDLQVLLEAHGNPVVALPNNVTMPIISNSALEQEISRLSTLDFFMSIFDNDNGDPESIIMKLEPILEPDDLATNSVVHDSDSEAEVNSLKDFLNSGGALLRLFLWKRLQQAYADIEYGPKVVSCLLRSLEVIAHELQTDRHMAASQSERQLTTFRWIHDADEIVSKILAKVAEENIPFECVDLRHLKSSAAAVVFLLRLVHAFVIVDDSARVGQIILPTLRPSSMKSFDKSRDRLRDCYVRLWSLQYHLLKEGTVQLPSVFERSGDVLAEYLRFVHNSLGSRQYCKHCNKMFVKLTKKELLSLQTDIDISYELAQILYDMYQIKFGVGIADQDHGCTPELLRDKTTAMTLVPIIMTHAKRFNPRELIKSELKGTIEKVQQCLGPVKTNPALSYNKKTVSALLKAPINPQTVYRSLRGLGDLTTKPVSGDYAKLAATGWYFMLGKMSLLKFKSIKRVNPTSTDDLDTAATFLRHDLEHDCTNWESWYTLAQVFDTKIEDSLIWNSNKLNDSRTEIAALERSSIHSYTMAMTMAMRGADDNESTVQKISDMYVEFAFRLYASSRPPLSMDAFSTEKHLRHLSSSFDQSMSKVPFVQPFRSYQVWSFAAHLLRRKPSKFAKEWLCHYTLGKCLWKMFNSGENSTAKDPIKMSDVLDAFTDAVESLPKKEKGSDYILEPHYKIVTIVHKLVHGKQLTPEEGAKILRVTHFSKNIQLASDEHEGDGWIQYVLTFLTKIGDADKSNWHHRITARAARIIYDDTPTLTGAVGARHTMMQQIFTKTMTMQVWKPENECPGRHYVYTGRYLQFFVHILSQLNDRDNMEQLVRRIRRKTTDFLDHPKIWEDTASAYIKLLRRVGDVPDNKERTVFDKVSFEEFTKHSEKLEKWCHEQESNTPYMGIIQDAIELKRLNNSLMKGPAIDDLIGDTYSCLYEDFVAQLSPEEIAPPPQSTLSQSTFINMTQDAAPSGDDGLDRMRLNNLLSTKNESNINAPTPVYNLLGAGIQTPPRATPPADPLRVPTPTKPGRVKTVTRREVQRKAEAAINRPQAVKNSSSGRRLTVEVSSIRRQGSTNNASGDGEHEDDMGKGEPANNSMRSSRQPSAAVSIKSDEAQEIAESDNDSELSDLEDDEENEESKHNSLFPGLGRKRKANEDTEGDADDEGGEEGGSDGDEEDNDGGDDEEGDDEDGNDEAEGEGEGEDELDGDGDGETEGEGIEINKENEDVEQDEDDEEEDTIEIKDSQEASLM